MPWTGTPRLASGIARRPVPTPNSSAGPPAASRSSRSTVGTTTDGWNIASRDSASSIALESIGRYVASHPTAGAVEADAPVAEAHERVVRDDEVVEDGDVEQPARGHRLGRQVEVFGRWRRV